MDQIFLYLRHKRHENNSNEDTTNNSKEREIELIPRCANVYTASDVTDKAP